MLHNHCQSMGPVLPWQSKAGEGNAFYLGILCVFRQSFQLLGGQQVSDKINPRGGDVGDCVNAAEAKLGLASKIGSGPRDQRITRGFQLHAVIADPGGVEAEAFSLRQTFSSEKAFACP